MKKLSENKRLLIWEGIALLFGILTLSFLFIPAYFEDGQSDMSLFQIMVGNDRIKSSPLLIFGFVLLLIGLAVMAALIVLLVLDKSSPLLITILSVAGAVLVLAGGIILSCGIFISGLDKLNSELGFVQGSWGIRIGNILTPVCTLLSVAFSYPCGMIILHHKDQADKEKKEA